MHGFSRYLAFQCQKSQWSQFSHYSSTPQAIQSHHGPCTWQVISPPGMPWWRDPVTTCCPCSPNRPMIPPDLSPPPPSYSGMPSTTLPPLNPPSTSHKNKLPKINPHPRMSLFPAWIHLFTTFWHNIFWINATHSIPFSPICYFNSSLPL